MRHLMSRAPPVSATALVLLWVVVVAVRGQGSDTGLLEARRVHTTVATPRPRLPHGSPYATQIAGGPGRPVRQRVTPYVYTTLAAHVSHERSRPVRGTLPEGGVRARGGGVVPSPDNALEIDVGTPGDDNRYTGKFPEELDPYVFRNPHLPHSRLRNPGGSKRLPEELPDEGRGAAYLSLLEFLKLPASTVPPAPLGLAGSTRAHVARGRRQVVAPTGMRLTPPLRLHLHNEPSSPLPPATSLPPTTSLPASPGSPFLSGANGGKRAIVHQCDTHKANPVAVLFGIDRSKREFINEVRMETHFLRRGKHEDLHTHNQVNGGSPGVRREQYGGIAQEPKAHLLRALHSGHLPTTYPPSVDAEPLGASGAPPTAGAAPSPEATAGGDDDPHTTYGRPQPSTTVASGSHSGFLTTDENDGPWEVMESDGRPRTSPHGGDHATASSQSRDNAWRTTPGSAYHQRPTLDHGEDHTTTTDGRDHVPVTVKPDAVGEPHDGGYYRDTSAVGTTTATTEEGYTVGTTTLGDDGSTGPTYVGGDDDPHGNAGDNPDQGTPTVQPDRGSTAAGGDHHPGTPGRGVVRPPSTPAQGWRHPERGSSPTGREKLDVLGIKSTERKEYSVEVDEERTDRFCRKVEDVLVSLGARYASLDSSDEANITSAPKSSISEYEQYLTTLLEEFNETKTLNTGASSGANFRQSGAKSDDDNCSLVTKASPTVEDSASPPAAPASSAVDIRLKDEDGTVVEWDLSPGRRYSVEVLAPESDDGLLLLLLLGVVDEVGQGVGSLQPGASEMSVSCGSSAVAFSTAGASVVRASWWLPPGHLPDCVTFRVRFLGPGSAGGGRLARHINKGNVKPRPSFSGFWKPRFWACFSGFETRACFSGFGNPGACFTGFETRPSFSGFGNPGFGLASVGLETPVLGLLQWVLETPGLASVGFGNPGASFSGFETRALLQWVWEPRFWACFSGFGNPGFGLASVGFGNPGACFSGFWKPRGLLQWVLETPGLASVGFGNPGACFSGFGNPGLASLVPSLCHSSKVCATVSKSVSQFPSLRHSFKSVPQFPVCAPVPKSVPQFQSMCHSSQSVPQFQVCATVPSLCHSSQVCVTVPKSVSQFPSLCHSFKSVSQFQVCATVPKSVPQFPVYATVPKSVPQFPSLCHSSQSVSQFPSLCHSSQVCATVPSQCHSSQVCATVPSLCHSFQVCVTVPKFVPQCPVSATVPKSVPQFPVCVTVSKSVSQFPSLCHSAQSVPQFLVFDLVSSLYPSTQSLPQYPVFTPVPSLYPSTQSLRQYPVFTPVLSLYPSTQSLPQYPVFTPVPSLYPSTQSLPQYSVFTPVPNLYPSTQSLPQYPIFTPVPSLYPSTQSLPQYPVFTPVPSLYPSTQSLPTVPSLYPSTQSLPQYPVWRMTDAQGVNGGS
ncbi:uncharacterized protein [Panulirus ornatus]|uniref:uncharacterized protein n=1 Tax=Panulirus ornatus TaxID=150431 RepID=UPI003A860B7A